MSLTYSAQRRQTLIIEEENKISPDINAEETDDKSTPTKSADILNQKRYTYFETIFNKYKYDLKKYLLKTVRFEDVAEDIMQDVFVRLLRYKNDLPDHSIKGFLFVTAANLVKDRYRKQKVRLSSLKDPNYSAGLILAQENPEIIIKHKQTLELLKEALDDMDQKYHTAFTLYRFHNKKHAEIATIMGVTSRSVRNYIREAMLQLTRKLQAEQ